MDPGDPIGALDDFRSLALTDSFPSSILVVLLHIYYTLLTTFVRQPLRSVTEPHLLRTHLLLHTSYIMEKSLDVWNGADTMLIRR